MTPHPRPWLVAGVVLLPTFMEVLDASIANVALRYIAGGLSAPAADSEWVITSYLAANAVVLPMSGWLSARLGRRNYFLASIALFTAASALCGLATSLGQVILFRVLQGVAGGGLQPVSQAVLLDAFPPEKHGTAQTLFSVAIVQAVGLGPTLGGWLCVHYDWRWLFLINVPVGLAALALGWAFVHDPEYLRRERAEMGRRPPAFDTVGLGLLVLVVASWEVLLSKGQEWDWLADPHARPRNLALACGLGLVAFVAWELRHPHPLVDLRVLGERNLAVACVVLFFAEGLDDAAGVALPAMLQSVYGYDPLQAGRVMSPGAVSSLAALVVVGLLLARGLDARWLIAAGLLSCAAANAWMARMTLDAGPAQLIGPRLLKNAGYGLLIAPLAVAAFRYTPVHLRAAAVGLFNLVRNEGGSAGVSLGHTVLDRRQQFHSARVGEFVDPFNPNVVAFLDSARDTFSRQTGDAALADRMALHALDEMMHRQSLSLAYYDVFWVASAVAVALVALVPLLRRSVAEPGEHAGAE